MMVEMPGDHIDKCANTNQTFSCQAASHQHIRCKRFKQKEIRLPQNRKFVSVMVKALHIERGVCHEEVFVQTRQGIRIMSRRTQSTVCHKSFRMKHIAKYFLNRQLPFGVSIL